MKCRDESPDLLIMISVVVWDCMGRPFSTFVQPSRTCLETRRLSLNENLRATQGGKDETSLLSPPYG